MAGLGIGVELVHQTLDREVEAGLEVHVGQAAVHGHVSEDGIDELEHAQAVLGAVVAHQQQVLQGRNEVVLRVAALDLGHDGIHDGLRVVEVLGIAVDAVDHAGAVALHELVVVDGSILLVLLDLLVDEIVLEALHLVGDPAKATALELGADMDAGVDVLGAGGDDVDEEQGGEGVLHEQTLHADAARAHLLAGAHQTAELSPAVDGDLDDAQPGIEPSGFALVALDLVHGRQDFGMAVGALPVAQEGQDFADEFPGGNAGRSEGGHKGIDAVLMAQSIIGTVVVVHERLQALDDVVLAVEHGIGAGVVLATMVVDAPQYSREGDLSLGFDKIFDPSTHISQFCPASSFGGRSEERGREEGEGGRGEGVGGRKGGRE